MLNSIKILRLKYLLFIVVIILTTITAQIITHRYLMQQRNDASLLNLAGRQRMLSQRITKLTLFIEKNSLEGRIKKERIDTLRKSMILWKQSHQKILKQTTFRSGEIDSLLNVQTKLMESTLGACRIILKTTDPAIIRNELLVIEANDLPFLLNMQKIVATFQKQAEEKLKNIERIEYWLGLFAILIISAGFVFILLPTITRLNISNNQLASLNNELQDKNEEIKTTLNQISDLQHHLEIKEKQYRERVEDAVDAIYESNLQGLFTYVNPGAAILTEYSQADLLDMHYYELVPQEYRVDLVLFYENQLKNKTETTYKEFPIITKTGKRFWLAQTVRMIFMNGRFDKLHAVARNITDIYEFNSKLQKSERRFKSLAEHSPVGIHELNADAQIIYTNKRWSEISGVPQDAMSAERLNSIHPDDRDKITQAWATAINEKREISLEFRYNNPKRGIVWVISYTTPVFDEQGHIQGYIGTLSDITEAKEMHLKLVKSEETYRLISTNSKDLITIYKNDDAATRIFISPSVKNILGYEPEELIGKSPFDIILPEDVKRIKETVHVDTLQGKVGNNEYRIRRKDGTVIWMEAVSQPYFNDLGEMTGFQTSAREITLRKEMEQKLAERERLYRVLSENSQDLIALHNPDGVYTFVSASFKNILGYETDELIGLSAYDIIHPDDHERLRNGAHQQLLEGKTSFNVEYRIRKNDGTYIWVEAYTKPLIDEKENVIAIQTSSRDISQRKAFEIALTEAKTKAEEANKAKSQFLSVMSHEIRTPMNAVIGLTNFMIEENPTKHQLENLKLLKYSGENLLTVVNDILDFSKIEAGKMDLEEESFDLIELLQNITKIMQHRAKEKKLDLFLKYNTELPQYIKGDSVRINQVLINLIGNAIKFTESGQVELEINAKQLPDNNYTLLFSVTDTGIGIAHDKTELVFESFSQANKDTTRKFGGTGLGLTITKKLVTLMGGSIQIASELGKGSKFYFTLNLKHGEADKDEQPQVKIIDTKTDQIYNILLVEDNRVNQVVVANYLKKWGLHVTYANHGKEALEKIVSKSYHLVLMDMQMPEMNGYEATKRIRAMEDPYFKNIPILAFTASILTEKTPEIISIGFNDFITKPFNPKDLNRKLFSYLNAMSLS